MTDIKIKQLLIDMQRNVDYAYDRGFLAGAKEKDEVKTYAEGFDAGIIEGKSNFDDLYNSFVEEKERLEKQIEEKEAEIEKAIDEVFSETRFKIYCGFEGWLRQDIKLLKKNLLTENKFVVVPRCMGKSNHIDNNQEQSNAEVINQKVVPSQDKTAPDSEICENCEFCDMDLCTTSYLGVGCKEFKKKEEKKKEIVK
jgi:hypothetical protein